MSDVKVPEPKFRLTVEDKNSATWVRLRMYFEDQLRHVRNKNEQVGLSVPETEAHRGDIRRLKSLIKLGDPDEGSKE